MKNIIFNNNKFHIFLQTFWIENQIKKQKLQLAPSALPRNFQTLYYRNFQVKQTKQAKVCTYINKRNTCKVQIFLGHALFFYFERFFQSFVAFLDYLNFRNIATYFLRWSVGNLISFCIRTFIISPGVPTSPPQAPAPAAIPTLWKNDIGSPFGLTYFFAV